MARKNAGGHRVPFSASSQSASNKGKGKGKPTRANRASKNDPSNAYVFEQSLPKRHRTSEQQLSLSHEEAKLGAGPSKRKRRPQGREGDEEEEDDAEEQEEEMEERIRKLQMMIAGDAPGEIDEDSEESEIDSDEAWESDGSDEERWGDVFRDLRKDKSKTQKAKGKEVVKKPAKPLTVDLNESDDEIPPTSNGKGKAKEEKVSSSAATHRKDDDEDGDEDEEGDLDDLTDSEDEEADEAIEGESEDEFAVDRAARKEAGSEEEDEEDEEEPEGSDEEDGVEEDEEDEEDDEPSEAELPSDLSEDEDQSDTLNGLDSFVDKLNAADREKRQTKDAMVEATKRKRRVLPVSSGSFVNGRDTDGKLDLSTLIASHPSLEGASALLPGKADNKSSSSILKQGVLPAPLPTVVQDRLDREAAYEKTKEEGQKWSGAMKRIKEAEHLQFPLQAKDRGGVKSSGEVIGSFKAQNQFEDAITSLLNKANLTESEVTKREDEELQGQDLTMEEIKARRDQLRYQRELMFRAEAKAKRIAKIKSKTYRKLARKRASKEGGGQIDLDDLERLDPEAAAAEREKLERGRARERATLRHGAKSGRWARDVGGDGEFEDKRRAKEDMLELKERLQRKIMGQDEGASSDEDEDDDEDDEDDDEDAIRAKAFDQLNAADREPQAPGEGGKTGLMEMAFMKKAQDREMKRVAEEEKEARRDIERYGQDEEDDESSDDADDTVMERVGGNEGRMVFTSAAKTRSGEAEKPLDQDPTSSPEPQQSVGPASRTPAQPFKSALSQPAPEVNPWLAASTSAGPSRKRNSQVKTDKASRTLAKSASAKEAALEDERVDVQLDPPTAVNGNGKKRKGGDASEEEDEDDGHGMLPTGLKGFKQRDLVAEAFAGDNVVQDFAAEKARQVEADAPKTEDRSLPGWGSWGGKGTKRRKTNPKFLVKTAGVEPSKRKDFETSNVIITEKKDKKASKFQVKDLPYPYTSVEQYEARFRTPLGSEWNTRAVHQKETMPRVTKKPGAIIEPIRRLF